MSIQTPIQKKPNQAVNQTATAAFCLRSQAFIWPVSFVARRSLTWIAFMLAAYFAFGGWRLKAGEVSIEPGHWVSPDGDYSVQYRPSADLNDGRKFSAFAILKDKNVLWIGTSEVDESAHSRKVLWSPKSEYVLILNRPNRAECEILLAQVSPQTEVVNYKSKLATEIKKMLRDTSDTEGNSFEKQWYENWKWRDDKVLQGELHVAKGKQHIILLELNASNPLDGLKIIGVR